MSQTELLRPITVVPDYQWVSIATIKLESGTQCRQQTDSQTIARYSKLMQSNSWLWNSAIDPIVLFVSPEGIYPGDGHHRIYAAKAAYLPAIYAEVRSGTLIDAQIYALQSNTSHGLQLRTRDIKNRVQKLLEIRESVCNLNWKVEEVLQFLKLPDSARQTVKTIWHSSSSVKVKSTSSQN